MEGQRNMGDYVYETSVVGPGTLIAGKGTNWLPIWDGNQILPRYDEYGVGHTDNRYVTVGKVRRENPDFPGYGYKSDFSKGGYAVAFFYDENNKQYLCVVDINGNVMCVISTD